MLYYCPFAVHTPFQAPAPGIKHFDDQSQRGHLGRSNSAYAEMLKHLDQSVGDIRAALESSGLAKNTILIFSSDNGSVTCADPAATPNPPFKGGKARLTGAEHPTVIRQISR